MPVLPEYESRQSIRAGAAGAEATFTSGAGQVVQSIGQSMERIGNRWQKAITLNEYNTAKNETRDRINEIMQNANDDRESITPEAYLKLLDKEEEQEVKIGDFQTRQMFESEKAFKYDQARVKIQGLFQNKLINHQRQQFSNSTKAARAEYLAGSSEIERANSLREYGELLQANLDSNIITEEEFQSELADIGDWEKDRALMQVGSNPQFVIENIDQYALSEKDKNEVFNVAKASIKRAEYVNIIATLTRQVENENTMMEMVFTDKSMDLGEKLVIINQQELMGDITQQKATQARRYLKSVDKLNSISNDEDVGRVVTMIYDLTSKFDSDKKAEDDSFLTDTEKAKRKDGPEVSYLKGVQAITDEIFSLPNISEEDRSSLLSTLTNISSKRTSDATELLKNRETFGKASEYFKSTLPPHLQNTAMRQLFYLTKDREIGKNEFNRAVRELSDSLVTENRFKVLDALDAARREVGPEGDIRIMSDTKGNRGIVLFKDGKPVREVKSLDFSFTGKLKGFFRDTSRKQRKEEVLDSKKDFFRERKPDRELLESRKDFFKGKA